MKTSQQARTDHPDRELAAPFDPSLKQSRAELAVDDSLTAVERDVIEDLFKNSRKLASYAETGATDKELSAIFGVPVAAFKPFAALLAKSRAELNGRIRRAFLTAADKGSPEALAYLAGKYLKGRSK